MRLYHGPVLTAGRVTDPEQYTFSAVWLGFGVVLLLVGLLLDSKPARLASGAVVALTIAKVFLVDMSGPRPGSGARCRSSGWDWCWSGSDTSTSACCFRRAARRR